MNYANLDAVTRKSMLQEIESDQQGGKLYLSPRLSNTGVAEYPSLLKAAAASAGDEFLADQLRFPGRLNATEIRNTKNGSTWVKVPVTAPETMAEGEFNRFYARGVCLRAIAEGKPYVEVYRAKPVMNPRPESEAMIGKFLPVEKLLQDLRASIGTDTALGLPPGPNSGLSIRLA